MLTELKIANFGLIDRAHLQFHPGLNVLTGETGAGKSIIIDGLRLVLGERLRSAQIRDEKLPCSVEAVFELTSDLAQQEIFQQYISQDDRLLIIQREAQADGRSRIRVNGDAVTVAQLRVLGNHLMDFHGPHDHQMLLSEDYHLDMLDRLVDFGGLRDQYAADFKTYISLTLQRNELRSLALNREREMDLLRHQIQELEQVPLDQAAYDALRDRQSRMNNVERLAEAASSLLQVFDSEESGVSESVRKAFAFVHVLQQSDGTAADFERCLSQIQDSADQLTAGLRDYIEGLSFQPGEAAEVSAKYDCYQVILRKYGPGLEDAGKIYDNAVRKYQMLEDLEHNDTDLHRQISDIEKKMRQTAWTMSGLRKAAATALQATIEQELTDLGIAHVQFEARFEETVFNKDGMDRVVFYISPNAGEDLKPLAEIVSSGEAARLMLALKKALTKVDPIPVLVFDEIDAQIGGRLGTITGKKLKELSADRQVLLITHLPQIAVFGDRHFRVNKAVKDGRTFTDVSELAGEERVHELAQMMGGKKNSALTVEHAREMLSKAQ